MAYPQDTHTRPEAKPYWNAYRPTYSPQTPRRQFVNPHTEQRSYGHVPKYPHRSPSYDNPNDVPIRHHRPAVETSHAQSYNHAPDADAETAYAADTYNDYNYDAIQPHVATQDPIAPSTLPPIQTFMDTDLESLMDRTVRAYRLVVDYGRASQGGKRWTHEAITQIYHAGKFLEQDVHVLRGKWQGSPLPSGGTDEHGYDEYENRIAAGDVSGKLEQELVKQMREDMNAETERVRVYCEDIQTMIRETENVHAARLGEDGVLEEPIRPFEEYGEYVHAEEWNIKGRAQVQDQDQGIVPSNPALHEGEWIIKGRGHDQHQSHDTHYARSRRSRSPPPSLSPKAQPSRKHKRTRHEKTASGSGRGSIAGRLGKHVMYY